MIKKVDEHEQIKIGKLFGLNNVPIFKDGDVMNEEGFRFKNEPVRHKVLDLIGDLSLFGKPIVGHFIATRSGHSTNIELVKMIKQQYKK